MKVCVVIVTYNRKEYLDKLIESLKIQNYKICSLIIMDNHSNDNTWEMLKNKGIISQDSIQENVLYKSKVDDINFYYYYNSVNSGGSGGFNKVFSLFQSLEEKFDYLWAMDDDVLPQKDCLEKLISEISGETGVCIPNRSDEKFKDYAIIKVNMKNPFLVYMQKKKKIFTLREKTYNVEDMPFEGPLFKVELIEKVGLPDKEYFIFYDDSDYCRRCLKYTNIKFVTDAVLHKQIIPKNNKSKKMDWRNYYSYRNAVYFDKTYGENWFVRNISPILFILELCIKNILLFRIGNLKVILMAYKDAKNNKRGKTVEPGAF